MIFGYQPANGKLPILLFRQPWARADITYLTHSIEQVTCSYTPFGLSWNTTTGEMCQAYGFFLARQEVATFVTPLGRYTIWNLVVNTIPRTLILRTISSSVPLSPVSRTLPFWG